MGMANSVWHTHTMLLNWPGNYISQHFLPCIVSGWCGTRDIFTLIWKAEMKQPHSLCAQKGSAGHQELWQLTHAVPDLLPYFVGQSSSMQILHLLQDTHITAVGGLEAGIFQHGFQLILMCSPLSLSPPFHIHLPFLIFFSLMTSRPTSEKQQPFRNCIKSVSFDLSFLTFCFFAQTLNVNTHMCIFSMENAHCYEFSKFISFNPHGNCEMCTTIIPIRDEETALNKTKWLSPDHTPKQVMKLELKPWEHDKESPKS